MMKSARVIFLSALFALVCQTANAQRTEIAVAFSEHFFDTAIRAMFDTGGVPEFSIASASSERNEIEPAGSSFVKAMFTAVSGRESNDSSCRESIRLIPETGGVQTAVRFRGGVINAPLAFNGSYNPPFIGCVDFSGWAETNIVLEFDEPRQRLVATAKVVNVSLNGTRGIGGNVIARMVQNSIDQKINPIELLKLDNVSFALPIQNSSKLQMRAVGVKHEIKDTVLVVQIQYEFQKAT